MDAAIAYKRQHPSESILSISKRFGVPSSTLYNQINKTYASHEDQSRQNLSVNQEEVLVKQILSYAERGTLLTPRHITELTELLSGHHIGKNWTGKFLERHRDVLTTRFYRVQDAARIKADTPKNREAFLSLVSHWNGSENLQMTFIGKRSDQHRVILPK